MIDRLIIPSLTQMLTIITTKKKILKGKGTLWITTMIMFIEDIHSMTTVGIMLPDTKTIIQTIRTMIVFYTTRPKCAMLWKGQVIVLEAMIVIRLITRMN